jgi:hypothetical protein
LIDFVFIIENLRRFCKADCVEAAHSLRRVPHFLFFGYFRQPAVVHAVLPLAFSADLWYGKSRNKKGGSRHGPYQEKDDAQTEMDGCVGAVGDDLGLHLVQFSGGHLWPIIKAGCRWKTM